MSDSARDVLARILANCHHDKDALMSAAKNGHLAENILAQLAAAGYAVVSMPRGEPM